MSKNTLKPESYWSPYTAGVALGLVLFLAFFINGRGLGASGSMNRIMASIYHFVSAPFAEGLSYYASYFQGGGWVLHDYALFQLLGVLVGGYVSAALAHRSRLVVEMGTRVTRRQRFGYAFAGGALMAIGARIARGCTSGQVLTGSAALAVGSLVMIMMFFGGAYLFAYFVRRQWI